MINETADQPHKPVRRAGFSLLELMVTIAVLAILAAIALPNFRSMTRRNGVSAQVNALYSDLQLARSEAITTRSFISLCPRATTATAGEALCGTASAVFDNGWLAYASSTSGATYDSDKPLLHMTESVPVVSVRASSNGVLTLNSRGEVVGGAVGRTFLVCAKANSGDDAVGESTRSIPGKRVVITASGRVSSSDIAVAGSCG